jgi:hypothetical protein
MFPLLLLELGAEQFILNVENLLIQRVKTLEYNSVFEIKTLSVWFLRHCSETQAIWKTLNPKVRTYRL